MDNFSFKQAGFAPSLFYVYNGDCCKGIVFFDRELGKWTFFNFAVRVKSFGDTREEAVENFYNYAGG